jgi:hypothetical protein
VKCAILQIRDFTARALFLIDRLATYYPGSRIAVITFNDRIVYEYSMLNGQMSYQMLRMNVQNEVYYVGKTDLALCVL